MKKSIIFTVLILVVTITASCTTKKTDDVGINEKGDGIFWLDNKTDTLMVSYCDSSTMKYVSESSKPKLENYIGKYFDLRYEEVDVEHCGIQCIAPPCPDCITVKEINILNVQEVDLISCDIDSDCIIINHAVPGMGCALQEGFCINSDYYQQNGFSDDRFRAVNKNKFSDYLIKNCSMELECDHSPNCSYDEQTEMINDDYIKKAKCINNICQKTAN